MNTRTLVSVDMDWFNGQSRPTTKLRRLLKHIPKNTPAIITVQHHEFLPQLRKWVASGRVQTPFNIINIDEHHDYYNAPIRGKNVGRIDCGNWGFDIPLGWYDRYTWVYNDPDLCHHWSYAKGWLKDNCIEYSRRKEHRLDKLQTEIVAAIFCVSPNYINIDTGLFIIRAVEIVASHFGLTKAPKTIKGAEVSMVKGWRIAPRPTAASLCGVN